MTTGLDSFPNCGTHVSFAAPSTACAAPSNMHTSIHVDRAMINDVRSKLQLPVRIFTAGLSVRLT
eukprot:478999-Rhodomonas_salina.5